MRSFARLLCVCALLPLVGCQTVQTPDARAWGEPHPLSNPEEALRPDVAVDPNGNAVAVWDEANQPGESREDIWSNRYASGVGWDAAGPIEDNDAGPAVFARVAMDGDGNAVTVWHQASGATDRTRLDIWSNRYTPGGGWGDAELIEHENENEGSARRPEVAMDPTGNAVAVWYQYDGERENIWSNRYTPNAGWGNAELIETDDAGDARWPQVAMDPNGNAIAVWQQCYAECGSKDDMRSHIWSNRYTPDGGWGVHRPITRDNTGDATRPQVAVDASGNAVAVWQQSDAAERLDIWSARYMATSADWDGAELIEFNDADHALRPQVAMDPGGSAVAVWFQFGGATEDIWSNRYTPGGGWGTAERIEANDTDEAVLPKVAMDASGSAVAVWTQLDGSHDSIWSNLFTPSFGWRTAEPVEMYDRGRAQQPEVAMDPNGVAVAVWTQRVGGSDEIWSNRLEWPDSQ